MIRLHIVTVEDPVEFVHTRTAVINQRELGATRFSFANALKYVLRQDPDVILVGEMRDLETIDSAISRPKPATLSSAPCTPRMRSKPIDRVDRRFPAPTSSSKSACSSPSTSSASCPKR